MKTLFVICLSVVTASFLSLDVAAQDDEKTALIEAFQNVRICWDGEFDMVLAGDSRINQGISPEAMRAELEGWRIANFGFGHVVFTGDYLTKLEQILDPGSPNKVIVLGISPLALTKMGLTRNEFLTHRDRIRADSCDPDASINLLTSGSELHRIVGRLDRAKTLHPDGWAAGEMNPEKPLISLGFFRSHYGNFKVDDGVIAELCSAVKTWTDEGITVIAFLMPTAPEMVELEREISGFDEKYFASKIEKAGGMWISIELKQLHSYDGSHLRKDSAIDFSRKLAGKIKRKLEKHAGK
jgi:hypothetical protein